MEHKLTVLLLVSGFASLGLTSFSNPTHTPPQTAIQTPVRHLNGADAGCVHDIIISNTVEVNYPEIGRSTYPSNSNCTWTFVFENNKAAHIQFLSFQTEVNYDILKVYDGNAIIMEISGNQSSERNLTVRQPGSRITFSSDASIEKLGFRIRIAEIEKPAGCVHDIHLSKTAEIIYPENGRSTYPNYANCTWMFVFDNNKQAAHIQILSFQTEENFDVLRVYDGNSFRMGISGNHSSEGNLTVRHPGARITFTSDSSLGYSGFHIRIAEIERSPSCVHDITISKTAEINYPGNGLSAYPDYSNCTWTFVNENNKAAHIQFLSFQTEATKDILKVYDGNTLIMEISGNQSSVGNLTVMQPGSRITFTSDEMNEGSGFHIRIVEIEQSGYTSFPQLTTPTLPPIMIPSNEAFPTNQLSSDFSSWGGGIWSFSPCERCFWEKDVVWGTYQGGTATLQSGEIAAVALISYKPRHTSRHATIESVEYEGNQCLSFKMHMKNSFFGLQVLSQSTDMWERKRLIWQRDGLNSAYDSRESKELQQTVKIPIAEEGKYRILIRANANGHRRMRMSNYVMISSINVTEGNCKDIAEQLDSSDCGVKNSNINKIFGGRDADPWEWPWMVRVIIQPQNFLSFCGAALISEQWIVTAAHCIMSGLQSPSNLEVMFGDHSVRAMEDQFTIVPELVISPAKFGYSEVGGVSYRHVDIALIKLPYPLRLTYQLRPICLNSSVDVSMGQSTTWIGFGAGRNGQSQHILQEVELDVDLCIRNYTYFPKHEFCVHSNNKGVGGGDSGGAGAVLRNGIWYMVGLVSRGPSGDSNTFPSTMTSTSKNTAWINEVMRRHQ